jgi:fluoroquinolone transport system permease protein
MKPKFISLLKWDTILIFRYGIITIALIIAAIYSAALLVSDTRGLEKVVAALVFSDPVMYGFLFTAVMILFEKEANTHIALAVTPLRISQYIISKTTVFVLLALVCSSAIIISARPEYFNLIWFSLAVILSAVLFIFIGIIGVSYVKNFNQFILLMPIVLAPTCLPFLNYFGAADWWWLYIIPSQASLLLFSASVKPVAVWQIIYSVTYMLVWISACGYWAVRSYKRQLNKSVNNE